jgi:ABC-type multidrug transport system ATPase subunit
MLLQEIQLDELRAPEEPALRRSPDPRSAPAVDDAASPDQDFCFTARHLVVKVKHHGTERTLLDDVTIGLQARSLIAVIGPSGSGKSTLLRALTGYRRADEGEVLYEGRDICRHFADLRHRIGLVPQDDILHAQLTVRSALRHAAALRFPDGTKSADRERRVEEVLAELHLAKYGDNRISTLSGGQRKRVSVALELLTKPSLIFLDEPTSGLDPGMDREVMRMLRCLANEGRTVLVATHSVAELAVCDRLLVMAPGGTVAYFGPPAEALSFFGCETWADVFHGFAHRHDHDWAADFRASAHYRKYSAGADAAAVVPAQRTRATQPAQPAQQSQRSQPTQPAHRPQPTKQPQPQPQPPREQSWGSQLRTLIRRYLAVIAADRGHLVLLIALPLIMGALSLAIPAKFGLAATGLIGPDGAPTVNTDASTVLLVLAVGSCLTGAANAVRELIKERVIYERERAAGLSRSAYLMSKVVVLGMITALQTVVLSGICLLPRKLPSSGLLFSGSPLPEMMIAAMLLGVSAVMVGLVVSAVVRTVEKTMPLLVLITIVEVVFCGSLFPLFGKPILEQFAWLSPSRWAVAAEAATVDLPGIMGPPQGRSTTDPLWQHTITQWGTDIGVLVLLSVACGALVIRLLRRHEPEVMRAN